jgi:hypothetical protein
MNTLQTLVNIALNKPDYRERALHQLRRLADTFHAMEVEREVEEMESELGGFFGCADSALADTYAALFDIHLSKKNGALA